MGAREDARARLVAKVAAILDTGEPSRFTHEGPCRHGLRRAWVLLGARWARADDQAAGVIADAFVLLGVRRPPWEAGQPEFVEPVSGSGLWTCPGCGGEMDEPATLRRRFCSPECQRYAASRRQRLEARERTRVEFLAELAAARAEKERRRMKACAHCGESFLADRRTPDQRFCSTRCANKAQRRGLATRACESCGAEFAPKDKGARFCSHACHWIARRRIHASSAGSKMDHGHQECMSCPEIYRLQSKS